MTTHERPSEPWAGDLSALRDATDLDVPPVSETERFVLASTNARTPRRKESVLMNLFKTRPAMAALIAVLALLVLAPVSYALVHKIILSIDPDQPADQIENDVRRQLDEAGVEATDVRVDKSDGKTAISIQATSKDGDETPIEVHVAGAQPGEQQQRSVALSVECDLTGDDLAALQEVVRSPDFRAVIEAGPGDESDADYAAELRDVFAAHGFDDVDVAVNGDRIEVTVRGGRG